MKFASFHPVHLHSMHCGFVILQEISSRNTIAKELMTTAICIKGCFSFACLSVGGESVCFDWEFDRT